MSKKEKKKAHRHRHEYGDDQRGKWLGGGVEEGKGEINGEGGGLGVVNTIQHTDDDVL